MQSRATGISVSGLEKEQPRDLIRVRNLNFSYRPGEPVLKNVSFDIRSGDFIAVTGASGSGKSTLFYLIGALASRFSGQIQFLGHSYQDMSEDQKSVFRNQKIGFVFQQFYLLPRASVLDNVLLPTNYPYDESRPRKEDRDRAVKLLEKLGLGEFLDRTPQQLSGGQQQRVAIARALIRDPAVILADEPTGNLDSKSAANVMEIFKSLHAEGKTIVLVTHSEELVEQCSRTLRFKDGELAHDSAAAHVEPQSPAHVELPSTSLEVAEKAFRIRPSTSRLLFFITPYLRAIRPAWENIVRTKSKAVLTMLGVVLGIASVLTTISLGTYARDRILSSYETLGVNTASFQGWPNWRRTSGNFSPSVFRSFDWDRDVKPMLQIFTEIENLSPVLQDWGNRFNYGGKTFEEGTGTIGVGDQFYYINNQSLYDGRALSALDIEIANPVCVIGSEVREKLFPHESPLTKTLTIVGGGQTSEIPCRVIGVLVSQPKQSEGAQVNRQVFLPYTYMQRSLTDPWRRELRELRLKFKPGFNPDEVGKQIEGYFELRYGDSGDFGLNSNAKVIAQMRLFLAVFSTLLTAVAVVALAVGGVGINNMMLVNLSERLKELGLRKALGATPSQIRSLVLTESILLCAVGGLAGIVFGFIGYQGLILAATFVLPDTKFAWIFQFYAMFLSVGAILLTGILSGLVPAIKAERLEVIEAMRQD